MSNYLVVFDRPVWYQPDHPVARRQLTELPVAGAASPEQAQAHAYRTTRGEGTIVRVEPVEKFPRPAAVIEVTVDEPVFIDAREAFPK